MVSDQALREPTAGLEPATYAWNPRPTLTYFYLLIRAGIFDGT